MDNLKKVTYVAVLVASVMFIFVQGRDNLSRATHECDIAEDMASTNLRQAYGYPDSDNKLIERAGHYSNYYSAFCK